MTVSLLTSVTAAVGTSSSSPQTLTTSPGITTTGASLLVVTIQYYTAYVPVLTDSYSNVWTQAPPTPSENNRASAMYYTAGTPVTGSGHTFTLTNASNTCMEVTAWSGALTTLSAYNSSATVGNSLTTGSITPPANGSLIIANVVTLSGDVSSINDSFVTTGLLNVVSGWDYNVLYGTAAYLIQTTAAAINPTWSFSTYVYAATIIGSFGPVPPVNITISSGVSSTCSVGSLIFDLEAVISDGVEMSTTIGTTYIEIDMLPVGQLMISELGTPAPMATRNVAIIGQAMLFSIGTPTYYNGPNRTIVPVTAQVTMVTALGNVTPKVGPAASGSLMATAIGSVTTLMTAGAGFLLNGLIVTTVSEPPTDIDVSLRWSDTGGASWSQPRVQTFALTGDFQANVSYLRNGMARSRVFEVSWGAPVKTALQGVYVRYGESST